MADIKMNFWGNVNIEKLFDIHDNQNVNIIGGKAEGESEREEENHPRGPKKQQLFVNKQTAEKEKLRLLQYLGEHKMTNRHLTCKKDDTLNDIVTCFLKKWEDLQVITSQVSGGAIFRFLTETCGLKTDVTEKSYGNEIKERLKERCYTVKTMQQVKDSF